MQNPLKNRSVQRLLKFLTLLNDISDTVLDIYLVYRLVNERFYYYAIFLAVATLVSFVAANTQEYRHHKEDEEGGEGGKDWLPRMVAKEGVVFLVEDAAYFIVSASLPGVFDPSDLLLELSMIASMTSGGLICLYLFLYVWNYRATDFENVPLASLAFLAVIVAVPIVFPSVLAAIVIARQGDLRLDPSVKRFAFLIYMWGYAVAFALNGI